MKLVPKSINEIGFERGQDPRQAMGIGRRAQILKEYKDRFKDFKEEGIEFGPGNMPIPSKESANYYDRDAIISIAKKIITPEQKKLAKLGKGTSGPALEAAINQAKEDGLSEEEIKFIFDNYATDLKAEAKIYLVKQNRDEEKIQEDEENNIYAFIGFSDKVPVEVNGEKYYKDGFGTEGLVKIDKFDPASIRDIEGMKLRTRYSAGDSKVYFVTVPKFMMDEDRYSEIPEEWYDIIVKYKKQI